MALGLSLPRSTPLSPPAPEVAGSSSSSLPPPGTDRPEQNLNDQIDAGRDDRAKPLTPEQKQALKAILDNLSDSRTALIPELSQPGARKEIIYSLLREVMNPNEINQGRKCTCAATEILREMAEKNPVAYAQMVSDLVTTGTGCLPNGERITFVADSLQKDDGPYDSVDGTRIALSIGGSVAARSITERISQSAVMNHAMGGGNSYSNSTDQDRVGGKGLLDDQLRRLASACSTSGNLDYFTGSGSTLEQRRADIVGRIRHETGAGQQALVSMFWKSDGGDHSCHCVSVLGVVSVDGQEYVKIHNPISVSSDLNGTEYRDPPRELIDRQRGIELMPRAEFEGRVRYALVESSGPLATLNRSDDRLTGEARNFRGSDMGRYDQAEVVHTGEIRHNVTIDNGVERVPKTPNLCVEQQPKQKKPRYDDEAQLVTVRPFRTQEQDRTDPRVPSQDTNIARPKRKVLLSEDPVS